MARRRHASWSTLAYVAATGALLGGLGTLPGRENEDEDRPRRWRPPGTSRGALVALAIIAITPVFAADDGRSLHTFDGVRIGHSGSSRLVNRLFDEGDVVVAGTRVLVASGRLHDDRDELVSALTTAYGAMRRDDGDAPSPLVATYLGLQRSSSFDLLVIDPTRHLEVLATPRSAVIFLHGYLGNFNLPCWQIANAVASLGMVTACPSTRWVGDWWSADGEATLRRTMDLLHARGIERIVLAGLSNGSFGAARLAPRLKGELAGLVLLSGADSNVPPAGIPTLVIHGRAHTVMPFAEAVAYANNVNATLLEVNAGHHAMLVRAQEVDQAIRSFAVSCLEAAK